ncbi:sodium-dependent phosphate transporter [Wohlfahrtiimonas chitiniclastica]|uniref:Na/Pi cotransporter family protein n=1 Tax=Wohlfahrtiimonas chitiniclastica TaxID=400946 RepID=UPI000B998C7E|nr:Na/Pi cotransporter family protein [Wohlfahrtiimonas chitiniclastica]MBS7827650.1 Na/Pi cotransporter family protein [Wohlfahrtiimonas chitiniclastica]OYQ71572.1 sodium-dependent phosphate transporter [Wohlfahrtiimonas chitiniclastica]OYQ82586.1 sodium-dependent phosphate transporter [Wohlfahrtiimonas chitiniclastica]OYQ85475.1 sodium-dependent phosphate transporter [Wohlfahrtiimonas chitiniclastica]OYQ86289.1 sodium-dependent phosphate transporter [Wohlfahrtiimonas chitiniclastica]
MDWQQILFQFLGGLGLFLFAIKFMGDGLQKSAGNRLRTILDRFTTNPFMGILAGIFVTVLIQSSSGTTVITVGLVSAGLMTLRQAIGVIMGANIGTTVTAFIIGIDIGEYAYPILLMGSVMLFFFKKTSVQNLGQIFFGFGGLFIGLDLMSSGLAPLRELPLFTQLILQMSHSPILSVFVGTVFTLIVQSSSATIGILQGLYAENLISLQGALPVLFGDNIGTTITAVLAAIGATVIAKRAAAIHVLFNVLGAVIFLIFLGPYTHFIMWITGQLALEPKMQIAFAHGTFNLVNTLIQLPFIGLWAYLVTKLLPEREKPHEKVALYLDETIIEKSPSIAIGQAKKELIHMGNLSIDGLKRSLEYLKTNNMDDAAFGRILEKNINILDEEITRYLVKIFPHSITPQDSNDLQAMLNLVCDIERIGDHFENIIEQIDYMGEHNITLSDDAKNEVFEMFELTIRSVELAITALDKTDLSKARRVYELEDEIDDMERYLRKQHIRRLNHGECTPKSGLTYTDLISNLERIGDHAHNIAEMLFEKHQH